jgi:hypothetical protein
VKEENRDLKEIRVIREIQVQKDPKVILVRLAHKESVVSLVKALKDMIQYLVSIQGGYTMKIYQIGQHN